LNSERAVTLARGTSLGRSEGEESEGEESEGEESEESEAGAAM
jgi:hypothetical protein